MVLQTGPPAGAWTGLLAGLFIASASAATVLDVLPVMATA